MKIETIRAIKEAFKKRDGILVCNIKTTKHVNKITSFHDDKEVVFVKENHSGGSYEVFDLTLEDVQDKIDAYAKQHNFKHPFYV